MTRALALLASAGVLAAGCGDGAGEAGSRTVETRPERGDDGPRRDLRIPRPDLQGYDLLDVIVDGVDAAMGPYFVFEALESATRGQRAIYALWWADAEVNNGGFDQFFLNSAGALTSDAIAGARLIGAARNEAILREAAEQFPDGEVPTDRPARQRLLDGLSSEQQEKLGELADRWYAADRELERRMLAYVRGHPNEFWR